jgi:hypothetical protein
MGRSAILTVKILADATQASREMDQASGKLGKFQSGIKKAAVPAAVIGAGLLAFGLSAGRAASDAEQAMGAVDASFGKSAKVVHDFAKTSATSVGLSSREYEAMASVFGAQLRNMGVSADQLAPKTNDLVKLGADLAAQYGGDTATAVEALGSLLRGETDPIERYGVSIKQADIAAQKAKMGLGGLTGAADKQATTQATLALLTQQTATAQGAFAREADTAAGAQQRATAQWEDAKATLGMALLPTMVLAAEAMAKMAQFANENMGATKVLLAVVAGLVVVVLAANAAMTVWNVVSTISTAIQERAAAAALGTRIQLVALQIQTVAVSVAQKAAAIATTIWNGATRLLNATMRANPIGAVITIVMLLVAAIIYAYRNSETFRRIVDAAFRAVKVAAQFAFDWIKANWPLLLAIITGPIGLAVLAIAKHWDKIRAGAQAVIGWFSSAWQAIRAVLVAPFESAWSVISGIISKITSAVRTVTSAIKSIPTPKVPDLNPFSAAPATAAVSGARVAGLRRGVASTGSGGSAGVTINISGALDPEGVARQIRRVLGDHNVRMGRAATVTGSL